MNNNIYKSSKFIIRLFLTFLFLIGLLIISVYTFRYFNPSEMIRYPQFGIAIPSKYEIHGIDVSRYQSRINWQEVKSMNVGGIRIGFCFIKATEGFDCVDERFNRNWTEAKKVDLPRGAYHFFDPCKSGKLQATNFIKTVELGKNDLPPVLDIEVVNGTTKKELQQRIREWLVIIEQKYRSKPIIYTNVDFYENYLAGDFDGYPLWVAHYFAKNKPCISRDWLFWQHNENGRVNGISASVDFNVFHGDSIAFRKILRQ